MNQKSYLSIESTGHNYQHIHWTIVVGNYADPVYKAIHLFIYQLNQRGSAMQWEGVFIVYVQTKPFFKEGLDTSATCYCCLCTVEGK